MNDPKFIEKIAKEREKRHIDLRDDISEELLNVLLNTTPAVVSSLFKQGNSRTGLFHQHKIYFTCGECKEEMVTEPLTIDKLRSYLAVFRKNNLCLCQECKKKQQQALQIKNEKQQKEIEKENKRIKRESTDYYIQSYLDPNRSWISDIASYDKWKVIDVGLKPGARPTQTYYPVYIDEIATHIKNMEYLDFLKTPYWNTVSQHVLYKSKYTCQQCGSKEKVIAHHKTYEHHGYEHLYWKEDLICICTKCHKKIHNIKQQSKQE